jgi:sugar phosphate isomerase/epimerase
MARSFLKRRIARFGAACACAAMAAVSLTAGSVRADNAAGTPGDPRKPGLQLYSLRREMAKDRAGALATAKRLGFTEVEGSVMGRSVADVQAELAAAGLTMTSGGASYEDLRDKLPEVIANAKALGVKFVMCAWIPHKDAFSAEDATRAAADFNAWGAKLAAEGITFAYHAHGYEFAPAPTTGASAAPPDMTLFDQLARDTDPRAVAFEMDVFWVTHGGADPVALLRRYPKRWVLMHLKDMRKGTPTGLFTGSAPEETNVPIGTGQIDYVSVLREARKQGVVHYYIEDESPTPVEQIPLSLKYLASLKP